MIKTRSLALTVVMLGLVGSQAEAATRRGGWYQWWLKQSPTRAATLEALAMSGRGGTPPTGGAISVTPAVIRPLPAPLPVSPAPAPPPTPAPAPAPVPVTTSTLFPVSQLLTSGEPAPTSVGEPIPTIPATPPPSFDYDALLNFSDGPFAQEALLTTGNAQPWYNSPVVQNVYGGIPDASTREAFTESVLGKVESTYARHGLDIALTTDPNAEAAHSMSVVSGTSYGPNQDAIGITDMGNDGFTFIDKLTHATSADQLEWAVANNIAHELMHAFNVEHHSTDGDSLDAGVANWDMLISSDATFSAEAVTDLASQDFQTRFAPAGLYAAQGTNGGGLLAASPVPEPTTIALWGLLGVVGVMTQRRRVRRIAV